MTTSTAAFFIISALLLGLVMEVQSLYLPKRSQPFSPRERISEPRKRPFCNAFTGCGRKRSNVPALSNRGEEVDESIGSLLDLSAEPAIEDLSRQIMSEAKLWEAIQEANVELNRRKQQGMADGTEEEAAVPPRSAAASCALPPCYI